MFDSASAGANGTGIGGQSEVVGSSPEGGHDSPSVAGRGNTNAGQTNGGSFGSSGGDGASGTIVNAAGASGVASGGGATGAAGGSAGSLDERGGGVGFGGAAGTCGLQACGPLNCAAGSHPLLSDGDCCPHCEPDISLACRAARTLAARRNAIVTAGVRARNAACQSDSDCVAVTVADGCSGGCRHFAIDLAGADWLTSAVAGWPNACATCPALASPLPPCAETEVACVGNVCTSLNPPE